MTYENWLIAREGKTVVLTINRPTVMNALNQKTLLELETILHDLHEQIEPRVVVITGAGEKSFIAGADIGEMKGISPLEAEELSALGHRVFDFIGKMRVPVIAAVNGFAFGGGLELALACDFIYASENAIFGLVEGKLGLIPGFGGVARLTRRVGDARAREMIYLAATINADEAFRLGLVNQVVPVGEVLSVSLRVAENLSEKSRYAIRAVKDLIRDGQDADWRSANAMEQRAFGMAFSTHDSHEGVEAFLEKRKPSFE